jgi:alpha-galactosidase
MWRTTDDLFARWDSILRTLDLQEKVVTHSRPGHWNDPDMLQVGNHSLSMGENRAHFYLWAVLNAPLMAGTNLLRISDEVLDLLTNRHVIEVDQDWSGQQGQRIWRDGDRDIWAKRMSDGSLVAALLNRGDSTVRFEITEDVLRRGFGAARDVPSQESMSLEPGGLVEVPGRDARLIRFD